MVLIRPKQVSQYRIAAEPSTEKCATNKKNQNPLENLRLPAAVDSGILTFYLRRAWSWSPRCGFGLRVFTSHGRSSNSLDFYGRNRHSGRRKTTNTSNDKAKLVKDSEPI